MRASDASDAIGSSWACALPCLQHGLQKDTSTECSSLSALQKDLGQTARTFFGKEFGEETRLHPECSERVHRRSSEPQHP